MGNSGEKWLKLVKSRENVVKSWEKWEMLEKVGKVGKSREKWGKVMKSG